MKRDILRQAHYLYNFDRDIFYNRQAKKAFSLEFVDDAAEDLLTRCIHENTNGNGWRFYFHDQPSEAVQHELESVLG